MKKLRIHYLQHVPFEGLGCIQDWIDKNQHTLTATRFYENPELPEINAYDWLIIMGGPMDVYDEPQYPWLKDEKIFIRNAIDEGKTVLGICLGAQLIAAALGAKVYRNPEKEIGWFPVQKTRSGSSNPLFAAMPEKFTVFHWHGDTFELPKGATRLAKSSACKNQVFLYGDKVLALQFHFEATPDSVRQMLKFCKDDLEPCSPSIQSPDEIEKGIKYCNGNNSVMFSILEYFEKQQQTKNDFFWYFRLIPFRREKVSHVN